MVRTLALFFQAGNLALEKLNAYDQRHQVLDVMAPSPQYYSECPCTVPYTNARTQHNS